MNKILTFAVAAFSMAGIVGCANTESIPSDNMYSIISEKNMPHYCRKAVSKEFGMPAADLFLYPIEFDKGAKLIYGKYSEGAKSLKEFVCVFNADDTFAGIKMQHSNVSNKLCYGDR
jgi:hypothetical protein